MWCAAIILAISLPMQASSSECITVSLTARSLLIGTTDAARAVAVSSDELRVTAVLFGKKVHKGETIRIVPRYCRRIDPGVEYFVSTRVVAGSEYQWTWVAVDRIKGVEQYARKRHVVTRPQLMRKLRDWRERRISTTELQGWLATADTRDRDDDSMDSLALAVVERMEDLLRFATAAEACSPSDAGWLRDEGSRIYLERFSRLPQQETASAYEEWLDAHDDAKDEWLPRELEADLERSLEEARSWDHTIDCYLRSHPEKAR